MIKYVHCRASQGSQMCSLDLESFCMNLHHLFRFHKLHTNHTALHQRLIDKRTTLGVPTRAALGRHTQKQAALHITDPKCKKIVMKTFHYNQIKMTIIKLFTILYRNLPFSYFFRQVVHHAGKPLNNSLRKLRDFVQSPNFCSSIPLDKTVEYRILTYQDQVCR